MPMPNTQELARVVVTEAVGAPLAAFVDAIAPMAPDPFVPDVSAPVNDTMVIADTACCESVAVTETFVSGDGANARQISLLPDCTFVRTTNCHVSPAPVMLVTVVCRGVR